MTDRPSVAAIDARLTEVGGTPVHRHLPRRARRTVGPWCLLDHFGPISSATDVMSVGPHPHIGLQTVTWLFAGEGHHSDSLGNRVTLRPGQLNLMTAGFGIAHAELGDRSSAVGHGVQLWIAQPEATRNGPGDFAHHPVLPTRPIGDLRATVLVGSFAGLESPAVVASPVVGVELSGGGHARLALNPEHEHAIAVLDGGVKIDEVAFGRDVLADLGSGRDEVRIDVPAGSKVLLLGGAPLADPIVMWWNFVARSRDEIAAAWRAWSTEDARFGSVHSSLDRVRAPRPEWLSIGPDDHRNGDAR
jgi:redox-sensitive bicupin YhaK (pirin superfamily)